MHVYAATTKQDKGMCKGCGKGPWVLEDFEDEKNVQEPIWLYQSLKKGLMKEGVFSFLLEEEK